MKRTLIIVLIASIFCLVEWSCANTKHKVTREHSIDLHTNYTSQWMKLQNLDVHYRIEGEGQPLVLLHGLGASLHEFDAWTELLKDDYQIIRMDLPGFGLTSIPDTSTEMTVEYYTNFLHEFLSELDVKQCHMAGNSLGGWLTWEYTVAYPNEVEKIVLIDPAGYVSPDNMSKEIKKAQKPIVKRMLYKGVPKWIVKLTMKQIYGKGKPSAFDVTRHYQLMNTVGNGEFMHRLVTTPFYPDTARIQQVQIPTLILWGDIDKVIKLDDAYKFERDIKGSQLIVYKGVGHSPNMEIPKQSVADTRTFLQEK